MKSMFSALLLSLGGLLILVVTLLCFSVLPELASKFLMLLGCMLFGYGIAYIIVERKTPR